MTGSVGVLLFAIVSAGCGKPEDRRALGDGAPVSVTIAVAHEEVLPRTYQASGTVRGRNTTVVTSKSTGYVRVVHVRSGDRVKAGQPLVELEANDVRASVARARAALDQSTETKAEAENALVAARANAKIAKSSFDRATSLLRVDAISQQQFDEAEAQWRGAQAQELMAEARVRSAGSTIGEAKAALAEASATLAYAEIAAPFDGRVLERRVDPGALASPGTPLLVVADDSAARVEVAVEESRAGEVKVGDPAEIAIEALAVPFIGAVGEIVPSVEVASRAFLVKVDVPPEASALRPGTFARVSFHVGTRARLVVPTTAITPLGALDRVFVVDGTRARLRMITRGVVLGPLTEVLSGLSTEERVVTSPSGDLRDGNLVTVTP